MKPQNWKSLPTVTKIVNINVYENVAPPPFRTIDFNDQ